MPSKSSQIPDLTNATIDQGRIVLLQRLGQGAYGHTYTAQNSTPGEPSIVCVKVMVKAADQRGKEFQRREVKLHAKVQSHPNVVTFYRLIEEYGYMFAVLELADNDLFGVITEQHLYLGKDELIRSVFCQLISALEYCHSNGVYHRDLKPENILCLNGGRNVLIADFGLATSDKRSKDFGCGSSFYMSPECQGGYERRVDGYSSENNDVWALGVILINLVCGRNPWRTATAKDTTFVEYAKNNNFLRQILPVSRELNDVLKRVFTMDPKKRISLADLRAAVQFIPRFTMTNEELKKAPEACRAAAHAAWLDAQKALKKRKQIIVSPIITKPQPVVFQDAKPVVGRAGEPQQFQEVHVHHECDDFAAGPPPRHDIDRIGPIHSDSQVGYDASAESSRPSLLAGSTASSVATDLLPTPETRAVDGATLPDIMEDPPITLGNARVHGPNTTPTPPKFDLNAHQNRKQVRDINMFDQSVQPTDDVPVRGMVNLFKRVRF